MVRRKRERNAAPSPARCNIEAYCAKIHWGRFLDRYFANPVGVRPRAGCCCCLSRARFSGLRRLPSPLSRLWRGHARRPRWRHSQGHQSQRQRIRIASCGAGGHRPALRNLRDERDESAKSPDFRQESLHHHRRSDRTVSGDQRYGTGRSTSTRTTSSFSTSGCAWATAPNPTGTFRGHRGRSERRASHRLRSCLGRVDDVPGLLLLQLHGERTEPDEYHDPRFNLCVRIGHRITKQHGHGRTLLRRLQRLDLLSIPRPGTSTSTTRIGSRR